MTAGEYIKKIDVSSIDEEHQKLVIHLIGLAFCDGMLEGIKRMGKNEINIKDN